MSRATSGTYNLPLILVLLGGAPLLFALLKRVTLRFGSDPSGCGSSVGVSIVLGEYLAGSIVF
jgi:hypothetical protein